MRPLIIVKTGSTVAPLIPRRGDFEVWFRSGLGLPDETTPVVEVWKGDPLPEPGEVAAAVVTGSPAMVTDEEPWSLACEGWLARLVEGGTPVLGVCYGHHQLARALGGAAGYNPNGREIGTRSITLTSDGRRDPLFRDLPDEVLVQTTHSQSVTRLPPGARVLAGNDHDAVQAFAFGDRTWGVQFHPEMDADICRGYIAERRPAILAEGLDPDALLASTRDSDHGVRLLRNFAELALRQASAPREVDC